MDEAGLQWPCPGEAHPGTPILHVGHFATQSRAPLQPVEYREPPEVVTPEYPFTLITGRSLYQFNAGTMTGRTANNELRASDVLDISPADAARLGVGHGQTVRVTSRYGTVALPASINPIVAADQLFATFQTPRLLLNRVTGPDRDTCTGTPAYKVTAVRIDLTPDTPVAAAAATADP